jgi:hypothetical protein
MPTVTRLNDHLLLLLDMYLHPKGSHYSWPTATLPDGHLLPLRNTHSHPLNPKGSHSCEHTAAAQGGHLQLLQSKWEHPKDTPAYEPTATLPCDLHTLLPHTLLHPKGTHALLTTVT